MSQPRNDPPAHASPPAKTWAVLREAAPAAAPLAAAAFVAACYFGSYLAFINCERFGAGCNQVGVRPLLEERRWCPEEPGRGFPQPEAPRREAGTSPPPGPGGRPGPVPTPAVVVKTEGGGAVTVQVTMPPAPPVPPAPPAVRPSWERREAVYAGRLPWILVSLAVLITALFASVTGLRVAWLSLPGDYGRGRRGSVMGLILLGGALAGVFVWHLSTEQNMSVLMPMVNCVLRGDMARAPELVRFSNALMLGPGVVLTLASCATLWPTRKGPRQAETKQEEQNRAVAELAARVSYLRALLYVGMVFLVVGVLRLSTTFRWAFSFLPAPESDPMVKLLGGITTNMTSVEAMLYTLMLAAIYVPAFLVLRRRALALMTPEPGYTRAKGDKWLAEHELDVTGSLKALWPKLAAILAPLLVGSVGELLKGLTSI